MSPLLTQNSGSSSFSSAHELQPTPAAVRTVHQIRTFAYLEEQLQPETRADGASAPELLYEVSDLDLTTDYARYMASFSRS